MNNNISPLYLMELAEKVEQRLWDIPKVSKYRFVGSYIERWHECSEGFNYNDYWENFRIYYKDKEELNIYLNKTLNSMSGDVLLKIAFDLGVETPGFLPVVAERFEVVLEANNKNAKMAFDKAVENAYSNPADSVMEVATALDGLLKVILQDERFVSAVKRNGGLSKRITDVLAAFGLDKKSGAPEEIVRIVSSLDNIVKEVDNVRSDKTFTHGKLSDEYIVDDPLWATLSINAMASIGLFLWNFYEAKFKNDSAEAIEESDGDKPSLDDIPF